MIYKRILAFVLALVLMGSTFTGTSVTAYATTGVDDVTVEVETVDDTQEVIVEESEDDTTVDKTETNVENVEVEDDVDTEDDGDTEDDVDADEDVDTEDDVDTEEDVDTDEDVDTEDDVDTEEDVDTKDDIDADENADSEETVSENTIENELELMSEAPPYIGRDVDDIYLYIEQEGMINAGMEFDAASIAQILKYWKAQNGYFEDLYIDYPEDTAIAEEVWDAAVNLVNLKDVADYGWLHFYVEHDDAPDENWIFGGPKETTGNVVIGVDSTALGDGLGWKVVLKNTSFSADAPQLNLGVFASDTYYSDYRDAIENIATEGPQRDIIVDSRGKEISGSWVNVTDEDPSYYNLTFGYLNKLTRNASYTIKKQVYSGDVSKYSWGTYLYLDAYDIDEETFTEEQIVAIMANHKGEKFDGIYVEQESTDTYVYDSVVAAAVDYLKDDGCLEFRYTDYDTYDYRFLETKCLPRMWKLPMERRILQRICRILLPMRWKFSLHIMLMKVMNIHIL